jgi:hypothetical protein
MKAIIKPAVFLMIYFVLFGMTSMAISAIKSDTAELVLHILCLLFHLVICSVISFIEGKKAMKKRTANDKIRLRIIETGDDLKFDKGAEYKTKNGPFMGVLVCAPLLVISFISFIVIVSGAPIPAFIKMATKVISGTAFNIFRLFYITTTDWVYVLPALIAVVYAVATGIGYYLGGKKQLIIEENFREAKSKIKEV